jgi:hypothetical protein
MWQIILTNLCPKYNQLDNFLNIFEITLDLFDDDYRTLANILKERG